MAVLTYSTVKGNLENLYRLANNLQVGIISRARNTSNTDNTAAWSVLLRDLDGTLDAIKAAYHSWDATMERAKQFLLDNPGLEPWDLAAEFEEMAEPTYELFRVAVDKWTRLYGQYFALLQGTTYNHPKAA